MFRSVSNSCISRDMCITCWLENLKEREILEDLGADGTVDFLFKDLLHRKSVRYTGLQNYEIVHLTNLP